MKFKRIKSMMVASVLMVLISGPTKCAVSSKSHIPEEVARDFERAYTAEIRGESSSFEGIFHYVIRSGILASSEPKHHDARAKIRRVIAEACLTAHEWEENPGLRRSGLPLFEEMLRMAVDAGVFHPAILDRPQAFNMLQRFVGEVYLLHFDDGLENLMVILDDRRPVMVLSDGNIGIDIESTDLGPLSDEGIRRVREEIMAFFRRHGSAAARHVPSVQLGGRSWGSFALPWPANTLQAAAKLTELAGMSKVTEADYNARSLFAAAALGWNVAAIGKERIYMADFAMVIDAEALAIREIALLGLRAEYFRMRAEWETATDMGNEDRVAELVTQLTCLLADAAAEALVGTFDEYTFDNAELLRRMQAIQAAPQAAPFLPDYLFPRADSDLITGLQAAAREQAEQERQQAREIQIADLRTIDPNTPDGTVFNIVENGTHILAMVYRMNGKLYLRLAMPGRHNLCGIFALGTPPAGVTGEDVRVLLRERGLIDQPIGIGDAIWRNLANLFQANIIIHGRRDDGSPYDGGEFHPTTPGEYRTLRIIGEPGHWNAFIPVGDLPALRAFMRTNAAEEARGWPAWLGGLGIQPIPPTVPTVRAEASARTSTRPPAVVRPIAPRPVPASPIDSEQQLLNQQELKQWEVL